jgi:hypothetical protein
MWGGMCRAWQPNMPSSFALKSDEVFGQTIIIVMKVEKILIFFYLACKPYTSF